MSNLRYDYFVNYIQKKIEKMPCGTSAADKAAKRGVRKNRLNKYKIKNTRKRVSFSGILLIKTILPKAGGYQAVNAGRRSV